MNQPITVYQVTPNDLRELAKEAASEAMRIRDDQDRTSVLDVIKYLTAPQAAKVVGVTATTFYKYVRAGLIPKRTGKSNERYFIDDVLKMKEDRNK